jgi:hypothetical protein
MAITVIQGNVIGAWRCPECNVYVNWSYDDLANGGSPVCDHCDCDMIYTGNLYNYKDEE